MASVRRIEAEWLDELPAEDPRAIGSRRDLRRVNTLMLQTGITVRALRRHWTGAPPRTLLEIGAGDGTFMLRVARQLAPEWPNLHVTLLDQRHCIAATTQQAIGRLTWTATPVIADAFDHLAALTSRVDIITVNLVLHHFQPERLAELCARAARSTRLFIASEPRRGPSALIGSMLLGAIGCNDVTRHDAVVSVRAGFRGRELSASWPREAGWQLEERAAGPFSHLFVAQRAAQGSTP